MKLVKASIGMPDRPQRLYARDTELASGAWSLNSRAKSSMKPRIRCRSVLYRFCSRGFLGSSLFFSTSDSGPLLAGLFRALGCSEDSNEKIS